VDRRSDRRDSESRGVGHANSMDRAASPIRARRKRKVQEQAMGRHHPRSTPHGDVAVAAARPDLRRPRGQLHERETESECADGDCRGALCGVGALAEGDDCAPDDPQHRRVRHHRREPRRQETREYPGEEFLQACQLMADATFAEDPSRVTRLLCFSAMAEEGEPV
jgi:hypothetical protein